MGRIAAGIAVALAPRVATSAPVIVPAVIQNSANTTVADQGGGVYRVTKTGGVDSTWDAAAVSATGFTGDCYVRLNPRQTNKNFMVSLNTDPASDNSYLSLDRALFIFAGGPVHAWEDGAQVAADVSTYTASDYFFIRRVGSTITALKGATTAIGSASVIYTYTTKAGTLFVDTSFADSAGSVDLYAVAA